MYYIGFLKNDPNHAVLFKSIKKPTREDYRFFISVSGPYGSWREAKYSLDILKGRDRGIKENPVKYPITKADIKRSVGLTRKLIRMFGTLRKKNPSNVGKFLTYMQQLEKLVVGSKEYAQVLAKAYQEMQAIKGK